MDWDLLLLILFADQVKAPTTSSSAAARKTGDNLWQHTRRCDLLNTKTTFLRGYHAKTDYTQGSWVPASASRPSAAMMPLAPSACDSKHDACPLGTCSDGVAFSAALCSAYSDKCFGRTHRGQTFDRPSHTTYTTFTAGLKWAWQPHDECHFSPIVDDANVPRWREWAQALEMDASPMLWVGDSLLAELHLAFVGLTGGGSKSDFHRSDVLVNTWTLAPMSAAQVSHCEITGGTSSGHAEVPCPPNVRHPTRWSEDNTHHQLKHMVWTRAFEAKAAELQTLVLGMGSEWWRQHDYPASLDGCHTPAGIADAFTPLSSMGLLDHQAYYRACDVFDVKYGAMVANVVHYINSVSAFKGKVIFVTSPSGVKGCESASGPVAVKSSGGGGGAANMMSTPSIAEREETSPSKRAYWFDSNPQGAILPPDSTGAFHPFGRQRSAERMWEHQLQKHAPRLKAATLNISSMSDGRADVLVRDPAGECAAFCYPGLPHAWAEVMLRLVEQLTWGATDGLY